MSQGPDLTIAVVHHVYIDGMLESLLTRAKNIGGVASATSTLRYYRSIDTTIGAVDTELATSVVRALEPGEIWDGWIVNLSLLFPFLLRHEHHCQKKQRVIHATTRRPC